MKKCFIQLILFSVTSLTVFANFTDTLKRFPSPVYANENNAGLTLPQGFRASKIADNLGTARHITVTPQGEMYVKMVFNKRSKYQNGVLHLVDLNGDGKMDTTFAFSNLSGTGIVIKNGYLYASTDEEVFRYKLDSKNQVINTEKPERIITGLINRHQHESKSIVLDNGGNIYVNIGAYANSCQEKDRTLHSPGRKPCPILDSAGGIWQFKADKLNQTYGDGIRYATGLRNVVGLDWNTQTNTLFVMQHGRDQLHDNWPELYSEKESAELPSECMYELHKGDNAGWPYVYFNHLLNKKILAPEYGGDGKKEGGENAINPAIAFPGHLAPNGLLFYTGTQFPEKYKNGAFIAFHGSWNRAPEPQKGYFVVFVPFKNGQPVGNWEIFADGFAGADVSPRGAAHRPCGLAQGPDGSLYVSDDSKGTIYKITYQGK
jgi:glucose/arabinose dehydrogenase